MNGDSGGDWGSVRPPAKKVANESRIGNLFPKVNQLGFS